MFKFLRSGSNITFPKYRAIHMRHKGEEGLKDPWTVDTDSLVRYQGRLYIPMEKCLHSGLFRLDLGNQGLC